MVLVGIQEDREQTPSVGEAYPREVEFVISALEAGPRPQHERQKVKRTRYRARATLHLFSDGAEGAPALLYSRHVSAQALGFLTSRRLPLSYGGMLKIPTPDGRVVEVACTVLRCREAAP